jgi:hypothetical protein
MHACPGWVLARLLGRLIPPPPPPTPPADQTGGIMPVRGVGFYGPDGHGRPPAAMGDDGMTGGGPGPAELDAMQRLAVNKQLYST